MEGGKEGHATGIILLRDGQLLGGDSYFYYTGSYSEAANKKWRGELITHQHALAAGLNLLFGGRSVSCGYSGTYSDANAELNGTALVGKRSISFHARLTLQVRDLVLNES
jgi:hypothetical protein